MTVRTSRRWHRAIAAGAIAVALGASVSACSDASSGASKSPDSTTTTGEPGTATIVTFDVPATVDCAAGATATTVSVTYAVTGAKRQELRIDGLPIDGTNEPSATVLAGVRCDPLPHDVVLIAYDASGHRTAKQKVFNVQAS